MCLFCVAFVLYYCCYYYFSYASTIIFNCLHPRFLGLSFYKQPLKRTHQTTKTELWNLEIGKKKHMLLLLISYAVDRCHCGNLCRYNLVHMLSASPIDDCHNDDALLTAATLLIMTFIVVYYCLWWGNIIEHIFLWFTLSKFFLVLMFFKSKNFCFY